MRSSWRGRVVVSLAGIFVVGTGLAGAGGGRSAWEALVARDPGVVDDERIGWEERVALAVLTPEQAAEYRRGADPGRLILADGRTLEEYLEARLAPAAGVYVGLSAPCSLFSGEWWPSGAVREVEVRGRCGIPEKALAVVLELQVETLSLNPTRLKVWARDLPEPAGAALEGAANKLSTSLRTTTIANLCAGEWCDADLRIRSAGEALLEARVIGYFRPLSAADSPTPIVSFYTESHNNNFFGSGAGVYTTGSDNAFFGGSAGFLNTTGSENSFFGKFAGNHNTTASANSFFGYAAGAYNTGHSNSFFGWSAGLNNTIGVANAFFGAEAGYENTSGTFNAFLGRSAGYNNTTGSSNAFVGGMAGYSNTTGDDNAFFGFSAGYANTTGHSNALFGKDAGRANTTGAHNAFFGGFAGLNNTEGAANAFFGRDAGRANTTGSYNAFFGRAAGYNNTVGSDNAFFGWNAGYYNTTGSNNAFFGRRAGQNNTEGHSNAFFGDYAGRANTTASNNAFFGREAGVSNTTGANNAFFGRSAGYNNTEGAGNAFFGPLAGFSNTTGSQNVFLGGTSGFSNTTGGNNAFFGLNAGQNNTTGSENAFVGFNAGASNGVEPNNTFVGARSNGAAGIANATALGHRAQVSQSNSLVLGSVAGLNGAAANVNVGIGVPAPQRQLHLKGNNAVFRMDRDSDTAAFMIVRTNAAGSPLKTFVVGTNAAGADNGEFVVNDLGVEVGGPGLRRMTITNAGETHFTGIVRAPSFVSTSSLRFKTEIATLSNALETVDRLRGVRFVWKDTGKPSVGLIAEEVAEVIPEVVDREENGLEAAGVNYSALVAVLVEAVKSQRAELASLRSRLAEIESRLAGGPSHFVAAQR